MERMKINPLPKEDCFHSLCINLTNRCNTQCKYCFQKSGVKGQDHINLKDIHRVLKFFATKQNSHEKYLQLTGGEIFLHSDVFEIVQLALSFGYTLRLQTNGLIFNEMTENQLRILSHPKILIKVSLDGWDSQTHEKYRARGSFQQVVNGIQIIRKWNRNIGIKTVVHELNLPELWKILDFCRQSKVSGFSYNLLRLEGKAANLKAKSVKELDVVKKLVPYFNQRKYRYLLNGTNILKYYLVGSNAIQIPGEFYIDFNGGIFPNQESREEERIGSIFQEDLSKQFDTNSLFYPSLVIPDQVYKYIKQNLFA